MKFFVLLTALAAVSACKIATPLSGPGYGFFSGVREAPERELVVALACAKLTEDEAARKSSGRMPGASTANWVTSRNS